MVRLEKQQVKKELKNEVTNWFNKRVQFNPFFTESMTSLYSDYCEDHKKEKRVTIIIPPKTFAFIFKQICSNNVAENRVSFVYRSQSVVIGVQLKN